MRSTAGGKAKFASLVLAVVLTFMPFSAAAAQGGITIKITMNTQAPKVLAVELISSQTEWEIGEVEPNETKRTDPPKEWCAITNTGNCPLDLTIKGEDAVDVSDPDYKWVLSDDGTNGKDKYVLWYWIARHSANYTLVTTSERLFYSGLEEGESKQFGLKLKTPTEFELDRNMETHITISAVAA